MNASRTATGLDPAALRREMPRELFELPLTATLGKVLLMAGVSAALVFWITIEDAWFVRAPLGVLLGLTLFTLGATGHDSGHGSASRNRFLNDLTGALTMSLVGMPARGWKVYHDIHHRETGLPGRDTDAQYTVAQYVMLSPRRRRMTRWVNEHEYLFWPLGALFIAGICWSYALAIESGRGRYPRRVRAWNRVDMAVALGVVAAVAAYGVTFGPAAFFFACLLPYAVGGMIGAATFTTNHRNLPPLTSEQAKRVSAHFHVNTRTLTFPRWLPGNWFLCHVPWQIEHHAFPRVAGARLARVSPWVRRHAAQRGIELTYVNYFRCTIDIARTRYAWGADGRLHAFEDIDRLLAAGAAPAAIPGYAAESRAVGRRDLRDLCGLR